MTKEMYIQIYRKIFATIRHDIFVKVKQAQKELMVAHLPDQKFEEIFQSVWKRFENVREDIYNLMMDESVSQKIAKRVM